MYNRSEGFPCDNKRYLDNPAEVKEWLRELRKDAPNVQRGISF